MTQQKHTEPLQRSEPATNLIDDTLIPLTALERDELLDKKFNFRELVYPLDRELGASELRRLFRREVVSYVLEIRYARKDRSALSVRTTTTALKRSPDGRTVLTVGVVAAPAALGFAGAPPRNPDRHGASFWSRDFIRRIGECSDGFKVLLGRPVDGPVPSLPECMAQIHPEDRPRILNDLERARKGLFHSSEFRLYRPNGKLRWVSQAVTPMVNAVGEVMGVAGSCLDITDAKHFAKYTPSATTVRAVKQHIDLHWDQPLRIADLAHAAGVNTSTLFKHCKQDSGFTPQEYLKQVRLNHAHAMLQMADRYTTVLGIALKCCFQNQGHFARDYRLSFGERPSDTLERARRLAVEI